MHPVLTVRVVQEMMNSNGVGAADLNTNLDQRSCLVVQQINQNQSALHRTNESGDSRVCLPISRYGLVLLLHLLVWSLTCFNTPLFDRLLIHNSSSAEMGK